MDEGDFLNMDQETFHRLLKKFLVKKCECGVILPSYPYYTETTEYVVCGNCGKTYERKRSYKNDWLFTLFD